MEEVVIRLAHKSKKFLQKNCKVACSILDGCYYNHDQTANELCKRTGIKKQNLNYWLNKLMEEGFITKRYQGCYEITDAGKKFYCTSVKQKEKGLVRLENMRYQCEIYEGLENIIKYAGLSEAKGMKNIKKYDGELFGYTVSVIVSPNEASLQINCKKRHDCDIYEAMYWAKNEIEIVLNKIKEKFKLRLGMLEPSMEPEWAIPSPMAEALLSSTGSSQIRTDKWVINRSKGRNADLETRDINLVHDMLNLPNIVKQLANDVNWIKMLLATTRSTGGIQHLVI